MKLFLLLFSIVLMAHASMAQFCIKGYYELNNDAVDYSSNSNDGLISGAVGATDSLGIVNGALSFDGMDDYVEFPDDFDYQYRTVSVWFNANDITSSRGPIYSSDHPNMLYGNTVLTTVETGGVDYIEYMAGGNSLNLYTQPIQVNRWYMATIVVDTNEIRYYLDCQLVGTYDVYTNSSQSSGSIYAHLGCNRDISKFFDGKLDNARVYNCSLTDSEVCNIYNTDFNNVCNVTHHYMLDNTADDNVNSFDGVVVGPVSATDMNSVPNSCYEFDGVDDYIEFPDDFDYQYRTVSVWFNADNITTNPGPIYSSDHPNMTNGNTIITTVESGGIDYIQYMAGGNSLNLHEEPIQENTWYLATIVVDTNEIRYYLDCQLVGTYDVYSNSSQSSGSIYAHLGCNRDISKFFDGKIDDLRIYQCPVDSSEICDIFLSDPEMEFDQLNAYVYPNPFVDNATLEIDNPNNQSYTFSIYSSTGNLIKTVNNINGREYIINSKGMSSGIYYYTLTSGLGERAYSGKFIVQQ